MFSAVACESEPEPDTVVAVMPHCTKQTTGDNRGMYPSTSDERLGEDCFSYTDDEWKKGSIGALNNITHYTNKRWKLTIKTAQGTTYTAEVQPSLRPQIGDTFP